jgi:hypothetical protein
MKSGKIKLLILIVVSLGASYFLFTETDIFIPSQTKIYNSKKLKLEIIKELEKRIKFKDTLFLMTSQLYGTCGNELEYEMTPISKKIEQAQYNMDNPFYIDNDYEEYYHINDKIVITGQGFDNTFTSNELSFRYSNEQEYNTTARLKLDAAIYDIKLFPTEDNVEVISTQINIQKEIKFSMIFNGSKWTPEHKLR